MQPEERPITRRNQQPTVWRRLRPRTGWYSWVITRAGTPLAVCVCVLSLLGDRAKTIAIYGVMLYAVLVIPWAIVQIERILRRGFVLRNFVEAWMTLIGLLLTSASALTFVLMIVTHSPEIFDLSTLPGLLIIGGLCVGLCVGLPLLFISLFRLALANDLADLTNRLADAANQTHAP